MDSGKGTQTGSAGRKVLHGGDAAAGRQALELFLNLFQRALDGRKALRPYGSYCL